MSKTLVIVESPAKTRTIGAFLGPDFDVVATMGHIIDLPRSELGVDVDDGFTPKYSVIKGKEKYLTAIKKHAKTADRVVLACDPDREGEAIAYHVSRNLPEGAEVSRARFNEITRGAVRAAIEQAGEIDGRLVNAQQARRVMDRLVGYQVSPLLWKTVARGLSAGRVQSVALRLVCEREDEVEAFDPQPYWQVEATVRTSDGAVVVLRIIRRGGEELSLSGYAETTELLLSLWERPFVVVERKVSTSKRRPAPPFTTASLQREASSRLGFRPARTMRIAQMLYEGLDLGDGDPVGLITYMRTDSIRIAHSARAEAVEYVEKNLGDNYLPPGGKGRAFRAKKGSQDAHECIRPTSVQRTPDSIRARLTPEQSKLYELVWRRFVASQMADAEIETTSLIARSGDVEGRASHSILAFDGWQRVHPPQRKDEDKTPIPEVMEGDELAVVRLLADEKWTSPPARYSEATLVRALEELGIGRPSTYAQILETIATRRYVDREGKTLRPTMLGRVVNRILVESFSDVFDVSFTADFERRLDEVEAGEADWQTVVRGFYGPFSEDLAAAEGRRAELKKMSTLPSDEVCHECGRPMVIKFGRYGSFLSCTGFPECKGARPISTGIACPRKNCEGTLAERRSKKGRTFFGCTSWPDCDYTLPGRPVEQECPSCGHPLMYAARRGTKNVTCPECKTKAPRRVEDDA
jgi:DNA topoisomerase-1